MAINMMLVDTVLCLMIIIDTCYYVSQFLSLVTSCCIRITIVPSIFQVTFDGKDFLGIVSDFFVSLFNTGFFCTLLCSNGYICILI